MVFRAGEAFVDVLYGIDQKNWRMDYIGISMIFRGILTLIAFALLLWLFDLLTAVIGMAILSLLITFLFDVRKTKKLAQFTAFAGKKIFSLLKRCFPLMLVLLISTFIVTFARVSIERIYGEEDLGIYSSAINLTVFIQVSASLLFTPLVNLLAESLKEANKRKFLKLFTTSFLFITGITVFFTVTFHIFGEFLLRVLFADTITAYAFLMTGASIAAGLTAVMWFMNVVFSTVRDIKGIFVCNLIGVIICLATTETLLRTHGLQGANYIMIISQGAAVLCTFIRLFWVLKRKPELFKAL
jgi:O-antigen/teichoic acid export membrane protein